MDCAAGVKATTEDTASNSTTPRSTPKAAPSKRSGSDSGVAWISMRISLAARPHTTSAAMKHRLSAAARLSAEPGVPTGRLGANCGAAHCAANHATTQPASDRHSKTRPRNRPTSTEAASTASKVQSAQDSAGSRSFKADPSPGLRHGAGHNDRHSARTAAGKPPRLTLAATASASARVA